jgi:hypothetical protein
MWGLWFFPLVTLIFLGGLVVAVIYAVIARPKKGRTWLALIAIPSGCALLPIIAVMLLAGLGTVLQKSDARLFEEIYGFIPEMREDQMLSDDFGTWSNRSVYMRLEATPNDRKRILDLAPRRSGLTADQFAVRGTVEGFTWWDTVCYKPAIYNADGYRGWQTLTVYDCPERQVMFIVALRS